MNDPNNKKKTHSNITLEKAYSKKYPTNTFTSHDQDHYSFHNLTHPY